MANEKHLETLRQGSEIWNQWRKDNLDLNKIPINTRTRPDFKRASLEGASLERANLENANLQNADLKGANLRGANLRGANLSFSNLENANLQNSNLQNADLQNAELISANLEKVNLCRANLESADLTNALLVDSNLGCADLNNGILINTKLNNAHLNSVNMASVNLEDADLSNANLEDSNLRNADLKSAILRGAKLDRCNLTKIDAFRTNFKGAILTGSCIEDWKIDSYTNLKNTKCDYVFMEEHFGDRHPRDPNKFFEPREFAKLVQKNTQLVKCSVMKAQQYQLLAVHYSIKDTQEINKDTLLKLKSVENFENEKSLIEIEVSENADTIKISEDIMKSYELARKVFAIYHLANFEDQQQIIKMLIDKKIEEYSRQDRIQIINNISGNYYKQDGSIGIGHNQGNISEDAKISGKINEVIQ